MIRNPQQSVGCWIMEKQVTSNITQLSLAESLEKWLGRQVLASFSLIRSSILVMKELHLRWIGATLGPFLFLGLLKYHLLNFHAEEHLPILWKSVYRSSETHQEVSQSSRPLPIDCIRSRFFVALSIIASSNGRFPLLGLVLRWAEDRDVSDGAGVCIELSAEEHSAMKSSSVLVQLCFRICWIPMKLLRLQLHVAFHFSSIRSIFFKKRNILNHLHWDSIFLGDKPRSPDLFAFILLSSAQKLSLCCFHLFFTFLPVK